MRSGLTVEDATVITTAMGQLTDALFTRILALERRLVDVEQRVSKAILSYEGIWEAGTNYAKGSGVTWGGSLWIATRDTTAKPGEAGEASRAWRLAVKKGNDGRSSRTEDR